MIDSFNGDERILGDSEFFERVLDAENEPLERGYILEALLLGEPRE